MTNKFKVGDKVRLIKMSVATRGFNVGDVVTIEDIDNDDELNITIVENNGSNRGYVNKEQLAKIEFTKADLQTGDVVTLRNGDKLFIDELMEFRDIDTTNNTNYLDDLDELSSDLLYQAMDGEKNDIIKVERPTYTTVFERDEEVKEMTIAEISKALGYEVKIVKEEER